MPGKRRFSGFPGHKAFPWFGLSIISGHSLMPLMSFQSFFGMHGKRGFSGFLGEKALPACFDLSFISSESLIPLISVQSLFWHARETRIFRISRTQASCLAWLEFYQRSCFMCIYHSLMSLISFQSFFGMHGKRGFSGFLGGKALPWFDLSFISSESLIPLISV